MCASFLDAASRYMVDAVKLFFFVYLKKRKNQVKSSHFFLKCADANLISRLFSETLMFE